MKQMFDVLGLDADETLLVITDDAKKELAQKIADAGFKRAKDVKLVIMDKLKRNGQEPDKKIAMLMQEFDVQIYITSRSLSHTKARQSASKLGKRIASCPGITKELLESIDIDYKKLQSFHDKLRPLIKNSNSIRITTKKGTDLTLKVHHTHGKTVMLDFPGAFGNLPTGEVDSGIVHKETNGHIVFDGSFPEIGILDENIIVDVKDGVGKIISKNRSSSKLISMLTDAGSDAYLLAELGIGTNPKAKISGNVLGDEKVLGTIHIAFGNDISYNGSNDVDLHLDGVIRSPTIYVDNNMIMQDGKFKI